MKKNAWKKLLSGLLVMTMLLGTLALLPMTASAAETWDGATLKKPAGDGTAASPYLISSGAELAYLGVYDFVLFESGTVYLTLTNDVNLGAHTLEPIDARAAAVKLYGNGHAISNYRIRSTSDHVALFYATGHGTEIRDLRICAADVATTASKKAAALIANADGDLTLYNCSVDANSYVSSPYQVGGLLGGDLGTTAAATWHFEYCVNAATLTAGGDGSTVQIMGVGGIVGHIATKVVDNIVLDHCVNQGDIFAKTTITVDSGNRAGGLIGGSAANPNNYRTTVRISNSYNVGNITADMPGANVGGIYGRVHVGHTAVFENVYDAGHHTLTSTGSGCGIITGWGSGGELTKSFINAYGLLSNATENACVKTTGTKTTVLKNGTSSTASYAVHAIGGSNFGTMYNSDAVDSVDATIYLCKKSGNSYVYDRTSTIAAEIAAIDAAIAAITPTNGTAAVPAGDGTAKAPWVISNAAQLQALSTMLSGTIAEDNLVTEGLGGVAKPSGYTGTANTPVNQTPTAETTERKEFYIEFSADIDMDGATLTPLGGNHVYTYHVNGYGHTVSDFKISSTSDHVALFRYVGDGTEIRNLHIAGATISTTANKKAAALVANADGDLTLYNCSTDASTKISSNYVAGGLLGGERGSVADAVWDIRYCVNRATVSVGSTSSTTQIAGLGGIVGVMNTKYVDAMTMAYCANEGNLTGTTTATPAAGNFIGGLLGASTAFKDTTLGYHASLYISNCYNSGKMTVNAKNGVIGGIVGRIHIGNRAVLENVFDAGIHSIQTTGTECGIITGWGSENELYKSYVNAYGLVHAAATTNLTKATILTADGSTTATYSVHAIPVNTVDTFFNMYNSDGVASVDATIVLCRYDAAQQQYVYDRTSTVADEIARIASAIENLPTLNIASDSANLMIRIKLTDPFGFMAITSVSSKGKVLSPTAYDFDSYGFYFLDSKTPVTADELIASDKALRVEGKRYAKTDYFYAAYDKITASSLDKDLYFVSYAEIDGELVTSGVRMLNLYDMVKDASDGAIGNLRVTNPFEIDLYVRMLEYNEAYNEYKGGTVQPLKISTYNVWGCCDYTTGQDANASICHPSFVSDYMKNNDIDILGMQEVDIGCSRSAGYNEPAEIAKNMASATGTPYYWAFASGLTDYREAAAGQEHSYYGNALVSKYPILSYRAVQICYLTGNHGVSGGSGVYEYEHRAVLVAELDVDGTPVTVIVTHMDLREATLQRGVDEILRVVESLDHPVIVMGDMNASHDSALARRLGNRLSSIYDGLTITSGSYNTMPSGGWPIDHIYYSKGLVQSGAPVVHKSVVTSDHYPVSVMLGLQHKAE